MNQDEYKRYIIPILFFKRVSDVYNEETQSLLASTGDKEFAALPENHRFIITDGCHWDDLRNVTADIGRTIAATMTGSETANPETLRGIFSSFDEAKWTDKTKLTDNALLTRRLVGDDMRTVELYGFFRRSAVTGLTQVFFILSVIKVKTVEYFSFLSDI